MDASIDKYIEGWKLRFYHEETNRDFMGIINGYGGTVIILIMIDNDVYSDNFDR